MKKIKEIGEQNKYDLIRCILRENASREFPIGITKIKECAKNMGCTIGRNAIENFMNEMLVKNYETDEECDTLLKDWKAEEREIILCKTSKDGRRTKGYWMHESISDSEWMYLLDSVLYSKILTKKEADNLAYRITLLAGRRISDIATYRHRMKNQPYFVGDVDINEKGHIESRVLKQVHMIRTAIKQGKKVKFNLCVYDYGKQKVRLIPYGKRGKVFPETPEKYREDVHRICSPFEIVYSNGRYYMLGTDKAKKTEDGKSLKYKLYRIDLMTDLSVTRAVAITKEEAGIQEIEDLFRYRIENPYMFTGRVVKVRIRVDAEQFTQIVDWFGDRFNVIGHDANMERYLDIEVEVNTNSFIYWVLQYSGCVQVLETEDFRNQVRDKLREVLKKYEEDIS